MKSEPTIVDVQGVRFGGKDIVMIAGPCAVETEGFYDYDCKNGS